MPLNWGSGATGHPWLHLFLLGMHMIAVVQYQLRAGLSFVEEWAGWGRLLELCAPRRPVASLDVAVVG